ncbi:MAG: hypothetical protein IPI73_30830 [Betaproteobacteria bacterium]|nr:hypothetical protein [Betaproteobacteria bacterium]
MQNQAHCLPCRLPLEVSRTGEVQTRIGLLLIRLIQGESATIPERPDSAGLKPRARSGALPTFFPTAPRPSARRAWTPVLSPGVAKAKDQTSS